MYRAQVCTGLIRVQGSDMYRVLMYVQGSDMYRGQVCTGLRNVQGSGITGPKYVQGSDMFRTQIC